MPIKTYTGIWDENKAAHLLRRTLFGPTYKQIKDTESLGMNATLDSILSLPTQTYPLTVSSDEQIAKIGETWIDKPYPTEIQKIQLTN